MSIVDLLPALRERNGKTLQKSGVRLVADLQTVREEVKKLIAIVVDEFPRQGVVRAEIVQTILQDILTEVDGIDPHDPPVQAALELLSHRVRLIVGAITLLLQKEIMTKLANEPVSPCAIRQR